MAVKKGERIINKYRGFFSNKIFLSKYKKAFINQDFSSSFAKIFVTFEEFSSFTFLFHVHFQNPNPSIKFWLSNPSLHMATVHTNLCADAVQISYQKTEKLVQQH